MTAWLARVILRLFGWRLAGAPPEHAKCVVIVAPHTSNWDFPVGILIAIGHGVKVNFMMKDEMFRPLWGWFFRALGGIPINRRARNNVVDQMVARFREREHLVLVIPPEGTRKRVEAWKTGFYYIARGADVPVVMAFLDFARKQGGFGPSFRLSGDMEADLEVIRGFYQGMTALRPENFGPITFRREPAEEPRAQP